MIVSTAPSTSTCETCGAAFFAQAEAWGATCGPCIAARIELLLLRAALGTDAGRKPMHRAPVPEAEADTDRRRRA